MNKRFNLSLIYDNIKTAETLSEMIDARTDLGRFLGMWLNGYLKYKDVDAEIRIDDGGKIMLIEFLKEKEEQCREEGRKEGIEKGIEKGKTDTAARMLKRNMDIDIIAECTGYTIEFIKELAKEIFKTQ